MSLPFGIRLSPKIFSAVADGLEFVMIQKQLGCNIYCIILNS